MRLPVSRILLLVCALLAVVPATAGAATAPKVTSVAPLKLKIGERLTIRGRGFLPGKNRNTVVFKASGARAVFAKAESATTTKLVVKLPAKLAPFLKVSAGRPAPTRFQLRVLARKLSPAYTPAGSSPTIAPAATVTAPAAKTPASAAGTSTAAAPAVAAAPNCDGDSQPNATDADDDNDLLPDTTEVAIHTDSCDPDTDGDGMQDGWEYQSAKDFNRANCAAAAYATPCPGAKPYPYKVQYVSPLFKDADIDYDGDYLPAGIEYQMWKAHTPNTLTDMWYSDGLMASQDSDANDTCTGLTETLGTGQVDKYPSDLPAFPTVEDMTNGTNFTWRYRWLYGHQEYTLDKNGNGCLGDNERDEDGDFLSNAQEVNLIMTGPNYVHLAFDEPFYKNLYAGTDPVDADTDGNGIVDGMDDQDRDDFWNVEEIERGSESSREEKHADSNLDQDTLPDPSTELDSGLRSGLWVDPYNPCLPAIHADHCPEGVLLGATPWRPWPGVDGAAPLRRWPLYKDWRYTGADPDAPYPEEVWDGVPVNQQVLPLRQPQDPRPGLEHPLLPRPS
jgi:hypothetical protein